MKIPDAVIHGLVSRLGQRIPPPSMDKLGSVLEQEYDMAQPLTFIIPAYRDVEFHVMIRRIPVTIGEDMNFPISTMRWQVAVLVVSSQIAFRYDEEPNVKITVSSEPPPGVVDPEQN